MPQRLHLVHIFVLYNSALQPSHHQHSVDNTLHNTGSICKWQCPFKHRSQIEIAKTLNEQYKGHHSSLTSVSALRTSSQTADSLWTYTDCRYVRRPQAKACSAADVRRTCAFLSDWYPVSTGCQLWLCWQSILLATGEKPRGTKSSSCVRCLKRISKNKQRICQVTWYNECMGSNAIGVNILCHTGYVVSYPMCSNNLPMSKQTT